MNRIEQFLAARNSGEVTLLAIVGGILIFALGVAFGEALHLALDAVNG
ncbi:hypothetical protein [Sphingosinithalassobacter sp. LHW66-3]